MKDERLGVLVPAPVLVREVGKVAEVAEVAEVGEVGCSSERCLERR